MTNKTLLLKKILFAAGIVLLMAEGAQAQLVYSTDFSADEYSQTSGAVVFDNGATPAGNGFAGNATQWFGSNNGVGIDEGDLTLGNGTQNRFRGSGVWLDTTGWAAGTVTVEVNVANFVAAADTNLIFQAYAATGVDATNTVSLDLHGGVDTGALPMATGTATISTLGAEQMITADGTDVAFTFTYNGTDDFVALTFVQLNVAGGTEFGSVDLDDLSVTISEAPNVLLGDVDLSGTVDFLDIAPFIAVLSSNDFQAEAECDESGTVDFLDISPFITILSGP